MTSVEYLMSNKITPVIKVVGESNQSEAFVTMTIRQFEKYAEYCANKAYEDGYTDALRDRPRRNIDTVVEHCEQKTYTPAEMESFYTWANNNGWYYGELTELWHNDEEDLEGFIIDDVIKIWEETK